MSWLCSPTIFSCTISDYTTSSIQILNAHKTYSQYHTNQLLYICGKPLIQLDQIYFSKLLSASYKYVSFFFQGNMSNVDRFVGLLSWLVWLWHCGRLPNVTMNVTNVDDQNTYFIQTSPWPLERITISLLRVNN